MSIRNDNWIRQQCEKPSYVIEFNTGAKEYASVPFNGKQIETANLTKMLTECNESALNLTNDIIGLNARGEPIREFSIARPITEDELKAWQPMIEPFHFGSKSTDDNGNKIVSYGTSSYGYDLRIGNKFKIFTNINTTVVNPKNFDKGSFIDFEGDVCIIPPNSFVLASSLEYIRMPRNVTGIVLGKSTYARCFSGETKVMLADGTTPNFLELIERSENGERLFGYSVDDNLKIVISEFIAPRKIGTEKVLQVVLDNNEIIECTPDHKFITKEGLEVKAEDLNIGDSLFPLYKIEARGYESVVQPLDWSLTPIHHLADNWNIRNNIYQKEENQHRHHINKNKKDNNPTNIKRFNATEHIKHHNDERFSDKNYIDKLSKNAKEKYRQLSKDQVWLENFKQRCKDAANILWHHPNYANSRQNHADNIRRYQNSPEGLTNKELARQRMRVIASSEEFKKRSSDTLKNLWADPEFRSMMSDIPKHNLRNDITEEQLKNALELEGSIRGAAKKLNCDRSVFRRFSDIIAIYKERWNSEKISISDFYNAMLKYGSATKAAKMLEISRSYVTRHLKEAIKMFYNQPIGENHSVVEIRHIDKITDVYCLTAPEFGNFALASGVFVNNCGIVCIATPLEAEWEGYVTLEFSNTTPLPAMLFANEGAAQVLFFEGDPCVTSYADRGGKYQCQEAGPVLPKM